MCVIVVIYLTLCIVEIAKQVWWANSEDLDEMPHKAAFHLGLHCLLFKGKNNPQGLKLSKFGNSIPETP